MSDASPKEITFDTRATDAEEKSLTNLYVYVFNANGNLIGYKGVTSGLAQNTSENNKAVISNIKTHAGSAYIYAVANAETTGTYYLQTSDGEVEDGKLPINLNEDDAQDGKYNFTKDMLLKLLLSRNAKTIQMTSSFPMSGSISAGKAVTIQKDGSIKESSDIKLNRTVAKFTFNLSTNTGDGVSRTFNLSSYDIMNIPLSEMLVGSGDNNTYTIGELDKNQTYGSELGSTLGVNDGQSFTFYLPENLQEAKQQVSTWAAREDDSQSETKTFTNAPENGTYVVLKGKYTENNSGTIRNADVTYYVHLGDCSEKFNDYNVERNCRYTFNITVAGVNKIIVEAKKEGNEQPGAEGVVLEYGSSGKILTLDSHYEYMVMRFYQKDIKTLREKGHGYFYQISDINGTSGAMEVTDKEAGKLNNANKNWVEFAIGGSYDNTSTARGTALDYPGKNNSKLYNVTDFLKLLYKHASDTDKSFWTGGSGDNKFVDATCFVDENYYPDKTWDKFVNDVPMRYLYIANDVKESTDKRSVYATAAYGLKQYNIQTFYDRDNAGTVKAYGCETTNDEEGLGYTVAGSKSLWGTAGNDTWNGRNNMLTDIKTEKYYYNWWGSTYQATRSATLTWSDVKSNKSLVKSCMSRNRDLNGDGEISNDEVRWYAPTIQQYAGLWIGEDIISTESKLFNRSTSTLSSQGRMLYYASTDGTNTYFSEEGMATNNNHPDFPPKLVRCVRNLKSQDKGYDVTPDKFYAYDSSTRKLTLVNIDKKAMNVTGSQTELTNHNEREEGNKPASAFYVAKSTTNKTTMEEAVTGLFKCSDQYSQDNKKWRVPNQREFILMYLVNPSLILGTLVRTKFSYPSFRYSWYSKESQLIQMAKESEKSYKGYIRCISVTQ